MARLVKLTKLEKALAKTGYKLVMTEKATRQMKTPEPAGVKKKSMSQRQRKLIGKGVRATWAAKKSNGSARPTK